jgi:hypothetical protein
VTKGRSIAGAACVFALIATTSAAALPQPGAARRHASATKQAAKVARPVYTEAEHTLATPFFVVHYTRTGADHPRFMKDDDHDGIPNYVEKLAAAGNKAWLWYANNHFKPPLTDAAGPDQKLDIYVKALPAGLYGVTYPATSAVGGTFMVVDNQLDEAHLAKHGSLQQTVAHELFHVFQLSYVPNGAIPHWIAEGSALAMQTYVYPQIADAATFDYLDHWLDQPYRSLEDEADGCDHCYGGALFWRFVFAINGKVMPSFFGRLYGYQQIHRPILDGSQPLNETLVKYAKSSLFAAFTRFSYDIYRAGYTPAAAYTLTATAKLARTPVRTVVGLSTHYVPITVPAGATGLGVAVAAGGGPNPEVKLVVGGPKGRGLHAVLRRHGHEKYFVTRFRNAQERKRVMLIVTSGRKVGTRYEVIYQAL